MTVTLNDTFDISLV